MHAFLIIGDNRDSVDTEISKIVNNINGKLLEFKIEKIDDVRNLESFVRLSQSEKLILILRDIDKASEEALNAFLKNLEEPQENLYYVLTAQNVNSLLPTIISRCQIVLARSKKTDIKNPEIEQFLNSSIGGKFSFVEKIRDREEAIKFVKDFVKERHSTLVKGEEDRQKVSKEIELGIQVYSNLSANGNVLLQLTYMVISLPTKG